MAKQTRRRSRRMQPEAPRPPWRRLVLMTLTWAATIAGLVQGLRSLDAYAASHDVAPTRIEWVDAPAWLAQPPWDHVLESIERGEHLDRPQPIVYPDTDIRDERVCPYVYSCVAQSPWVARVDKVSKTRDGRVRVYARFRQPFAAVERDGIAYLIDDEGVRLPSAWRAEFDVDQGRLRIRGVRGGVPAIGRRWSGRDVQAGLKLIRYLYLRQRDGKVPFMHELLAVDVSHYDEKIGGLRIFTTNPRSYIHWGHVPGEGYGVEAPADRKLATLRSAYEQWGSLLTQWPFRVENAPEITFVRQPTPQASP